VAVRGDGGGGPDTSISCVASGTLDLGHQARGSRSLGRDSPDLRRGRNHKRFRAGSSGIMLLVRVYGMSCCSKPVFIQLCCHLVFCGITATPQLFSVSQPLEKLVTLLTHARRDAFAIALYDHRAVRREVTAALRKQLSRPVYEVTLNEKQRNPIDLIRLLKPKQGDVVCLFDLERAFPEALGYLDLQRETLTDMGISLVCWATTFEHRELALHAPNFYAFRTAVLDFT